MRKEQGCVCVCVAIGFGDDRASFDGEVCQFRFSFWSYRGLDRDKGCEKRRCLCLLCLCSEKVVFILCRGQIASGMVLRGYWEEEKAGAESL